ncbi:MAG: hypothetical protein WCW84_08590 [Sulfurimonas sp.]|jgi:hypothetical protein
MSKPCSQEYDPTDEELQYVDIALTMSTLMLDRIDRFCHLIEVPRDQFFHTAIIRALLEYEFSVNSTL